MRYAHQCLSSAPVVVDEGRPVSVDLLAPHGFQLRQIVLAAPDARGAPAWVMAVLHALRRVAIPWRNTGECDAPLASWTMIFPFTFLLILLHARGQQASLARLYVRDISVDGASLLAWPGEARLPAAMFTQLGGPFELVAVPMCRSSAPIRIILSGVGRAVVMVLGTVTAPRHARPHV